ncbi:MAG: NAD(P)/FAD-dependent oxidoreductase [Dehalococcoidia bacterium]
MDDRYDVAILGGGLAGLTLAIQLKQAHAAARIVVVEKAKHPLPEAALKVGESSVEPGAHYFAHVVGMQEHLDAAELPKMGLRFFFPAGDNSDITRRVEWGAPRFPPVPAYQLDRGRFENALGEKARELGITFLDGTKVESVQLGTDQHQVTVQRDGEAAQTLPARWLVDASGRAAILKRQLGLGQKNDHNACAAWFRLAEHIKIDDWSDDPQWRNEISIDPGNRWLSTNHLMGAGYWVWLIPLASGSHSIGIVVDPDLHPFDQINTFDRAMQWLNQYEPQLWEKVHAKRELLQDFRVLKHYSHGCERVFSPDRWCLTGESGAFLDPFYSPGSDYIGFSNTLITSLIAQDLEGLDPDKLQHLTQSYSDLYFERFADTYLYYEGQYHMWGNAQVMSAKILWDYAFFWAYPALLDFHDKWTDEAFIASIRPDVERMRALQRRMQVFFREWHALDQREWNHYFVNQAFLDVSIVLHIGLEADLNDEDLRVRISDNAALLEDIVVETFRHAARLVSADLLDRPINPYAISLKPDRWEAEGLFKQPERHMTDIYDDVDVAATIDNLWLDRVATA